MKNLIFLIFSFLIASFAFGQESLKIHWLEEYEWKVLSNQEDENMHLIELVPGKEDGQNWTMLGQMMSIKGVKDLPMDEAQKLMFEQTKTNAPNAKLTFIEKDDNDEHPWILFKIESPNFINDKSPESQLWYIRQGETSLFVNFIAQRKKKLKTDFVNEWSKVFKESKVVQLGGEEE